MENATSACGKFILFGEHSILYGGQALVYPIRELRLEFSLADEDLYPMFNGKALERWQIEKLRAVFEAMNVEVEPGRVRIQSDIPIGKGLGSSAALSVAIARKFFPEATPVAIAKLALKGEAVFHGTSSGVDPFGISLEQPLVYRMDQYEHRPLNLSQHSDYVFILRDSGAEHSTSEVIKKVTDFKTQHPAQFHALIDRLRINTEFGLKLLESDQMDRLGLLLQDTNRVLFELGLGNEVLKQAIESLLAEGALGAKITGAGLGGYALGLFAENKVPHNLRSGDIIVRCSGS